MAQKKDDKNEKIEQSGGSSGLAEEQKLFEALSANFSTSRDSFSTWRTTLDEKERQLYGKPKGPTKDGKANVNDPRLFSQTFERSIRVMSQLATGKFKGISSDDIGKNLLMNLIMDRYVLPNANSQFDFLTKLRMIDWYSLGYGSMIALADWVVKKNYVGPDLFMIPIRNVYPQSGVSFADMEWCQIVTEVGKDFIRSRKGMEGWKNIGLFLQKTNGLEGTSPSDKPEEEKSLSDKTYNAEANNTKKFPRFRLITEYRRDRWITFSQEHQLILRDIPNPHENDRLPLPVKYDIPLLDFVFGLSEVEISSSLAELVNSLYNLAIDDAKMQLYPPLIIDPGSVVMSTIRHGAAQKWLLNEKNSKEPVAFQSMSRGAQSALEMRQMAVGSLQSLGGTSDTSVKQGSEATMGKTPQALKMQDARQSARDEVDRFYMESFISDVYGLFANLIVKKMPKKIILRLFKTEIEKIAKTYPDILELVNKKEYASAKSRAKVDISISEGFFDGYQFDYEITPGSTYKIDQQTQAQNLQFILEMAQNSGIQEALAQTGKKLDIAETISRLLINSGIQDPDKILLDEVENPQSEDLSQPSPQETPDQIDPNQLAALAAQQNMEVAQPAMPPQAQVLPQQTQADTQIPQMEQRDPQIAQMEATINQMFGGAQ